MDKNQALDALFAEYRAACPDTEGREDFMPKLWQRIEARRVQNVFVFRRIVHGFVMTAVVLVLVMSLLVNRLQSDNLFVSYADAVDAEDAGDEGTDAVTGFPPI